MATIFSDNFNRDNSTNLDNNWVEEVGDWSISGNELISPTDLDESKIYNTTVLSTADYSVSVNGKITGATLGWIGIMARRQSANVYYLLQLGKPGSNLLQIYKNNSGWTQLASVSYTVVSGTYYDLEFRLNGNSLKGYVNDEEKISAEDSAITDAGNVGLRRGDKTNAVVFDDFIVEDLISVGRTVSGARTESGVRTESGARTAHPGRTAV